MGNVRFHPEILAYMVGFLATRVARYERRDVEEIKEEAFRNALADTPAIDRQRIESMNGKLLRITRPAASQPEKE